MFKTLSEAEQREVRRWQAPQLGQDEHDGVLARSARRRADRDGHGGTGPLADDDALRSGLLDTAMRGPSAEMLQSSYDEGYAEGFAEGTAAAGSEATRRVADWLAAFDAAAARRDEALETETLALAHAMAGLILHREVEQDPGVMRGIVRQALQQLPERTAPPCVSMNPQDADVVRGLMSDDPAIDIVADESLARGDCRVRAGAATVNAGIDQWLAAIAANVTSAGEADRTVAADTPPGATDEPQDPDAAGASVHAEHTEHHRTSESGTASASSQQDGAGTADDA